MRSRIALAAALIVLTAANAFSAGPKDTIIKVSTEWSNGTTYVVVDAQKPTHAVLMKEKGGQKSYYSTDGGDIALQGSARDAAIQLSQAATTKDSQIAFPASVPLTRLSARRGGEVPQGINSLPPQSAELLRIPLWEYGSELTCELSFILGGELFRLSLGGVLEFVPGERELFAKFPAASYEDKAYSLLAGAVGTDGTASLKEALIAAGIAQPNLNLFAGEAGSPEHLKAMSNTLATIGRHYITGAEDSRVGDNLMLLSVRFAGRDFRNMYGKTGERNPYIFGYAALSAQKGKPLLSYPAKKSLSSKLAYDWAKFVPLTIADGEKLAESALRYLTGAVEYSQVTTGGDMRPEGHKTTGSENRVYTDSSTMIEQWAGRGTTVGKDRRSTNYLPAGSEWRALGLVGAADPILSPGLNPGGISLKSPFVKGGKAVEGNPIPFSPGGIDTPRSFAYRMWEQRRAKLKQDGTVLAGSLGAGGIAKGYADYLSMTKALGLGWGWPKPKEDKELNGALPPLEKNGEVYKPFLPGAYFVGKREGTDDTSSYYRSDMSAGVDSVGLLAGAIGMCPELDMIADARNRSLGRMADAYSRLANEGKVVKAWVDDADRTMTMKGLDESGTPAYSDKDYGRRSENEGASLSMSDIERMSIIIPHPSMMRKGDLVVGRDAFGRPHLGIIVVPCSKQAYDADPAQWMSQVHVVTIRRGTMVTSLAAWGNAQLFGGFSEAPETYQIRRLVKYDKDRPASTSDRETWEAMYLVPRELKLSILSWERPRSGGTPETVKDSWRWIPNTGEPLLLKMNVINSLSIPDEDVKGKNVILKIADFGRKDQNPGPGNLYNNKGEGIEFGYVENNYGITSYRWLASLKNNALIYNSDYFDSIGRGLKAAKGRLTIGASGEVCFVTSRTFTELYLKPLGDASKSKPGDDYEVSLKIEGLEEQSVVSQGKSRFAIYDKKMLWRANLYISNENNDWNDQHPWSDADNEWNHDLSGNRSHGGQVVDLPEFTWVGWIQNNYAGQNAIVRNRVTYDYYSQDTPFDYVKKMNYQKNYLTRLFSDEGEMVIKNLQDTSSLPVIEHGWDKTAAPPGGSLYKNYVKVANRPDDSAADYYTYELSDAQRSSIANNVSDQLSFPYVPSLSYRYPAYQNAPYSSGLDCTAFVVRSLKYHNSRYIAAAAKMISTDSIWHNSKNTDMQGWREEPIQYKAYIDEITIIKNPPGTAQEMEVKHDQLRRLVPGDVFIYDTHIGLVLDNRTDELAVSENDTRKILSKIILIESVFGEVGGVRNDRTLVSIKKDVSIGRLSQFEGQ